MNTYMAKGETLQRNWYVIDAEGQVLGRLASQVAAILRGKHKPIYTPHVDTGDHVIIINADKVVLTGNKLDDKMYYHHTGYIGGLKEVKYATLMKNNPEKAMMLAVKGMIPDNHLGRTALTRVRIYRGAEHKHEAQQPVMWND